MLHPKIKELQLRVGASPIHKSNMVINQRGAILESDSRLIKAYHCVWGITDDYNTVWLKGSWTKSIQERGPASAAKDKITVLYMHDPKDPLCIPSVIKEDDYGAYSEWEPDPIESGDRTVIQVRSGTINQFSFGFNYLWDKMEYDESTGNIIIKEGDIRELSPVTFGSQKETYAVRSAEQIENETEYLIEETECFIKSIPRKQQLELRELISRHISLAKSEPLDLRSKALRLPKPVEKGIDYNYLTTNLKLS